MRKRKDRHGIGIARKLAYGWRHTHVTVHRRGHLVFWYRPLGMHPGRLTKYIPF